MINPSQILNIKQRIIVFILVKFAGISEDTFVYICRDMDIYAGEVAFLLEYYFKRNPPDAKKIAYQSGAWGAQGPEIIQHSDDAFDHFAKEKGKAYKR